MDLQLKDKIIVVTGGAKGIGESISRLLAAEDALPVIVGRDEADNAVAVQIIHSAGKKADSVVEMH